MGQCIMEIVGICMIQNEDLFIEQVIKNIVHFCDKIIVLDNNSTDKTIDIVKNICMKNSKVEFRELEHTKDAICHIQEYIGKEIWIFGVDGDELYYPKGLQIFRKKIFSGEYQKYWKIGGYFFHVCWLNEKKTKAHGWFAPPSKEVTKLRNMALLKDWKPDGINSLFHSKYNLLKDVDILKKYMYENKTWDECILKCLHVRFLKRSSLESKKIPGIKSNLRYYGIRLNPSDKNHKIVEAEFLEKGYIKGYRNKYREGSKHTLIIKEFFTREKK